MDITTDTFEVKVIPNAKTTKFIKEKDKFKLYLTSIPQKGKANQELITFFKKKHNLKVEIIKGKKSRDKVLRVLQ